MPKSLTTLSLILQVFFFLLIVIVLKIELVIEPLISSNKIAIRISSPDASASFDHVDIAYSALSETGSLLRTHTVRGQTSMHIFAPTETQTKLIKGGEKRDKKLKPSTCRATLLRCKFWPMFPVFHLA